MSLTWDLRTKLSAAASVDVVAAGRDWQVSGHLVQPDTVSPLDAWPAWQQTTIVNRCVYEIQWVVMVALPPTDPPTYAEVADALTDAIADSLMTIGQITLIQPVQLVLDTTAPVPCLQFSITT